MRPVWAFLAVCLACACVSRVACTQYEESYEMSEGSGHDDDEDDSDNSASQEGAEDGNRRESDDRDDAEFTTALYGDDEKESGDSSSETTTMRNHAEEQTTNFLSNKPKLEDIDNNGLAAGSPYIGYRGGYNSYRGHYFNQLPQRPLPTQEQPYNPQFAAPLPDNSLPRTNQFERTDGPAENLPVDEHTPHRDDFEYLKKLRTMIIMARLRSHYGDHKLLPIAPPQPVTFKFFKLTPATHNTTQMPLEMEALRDRLRSLESERIKLRTILNQLKGILNGMHERANRLSIGSSSLNMSQGEVRMARLRNLVIILKAITKLSPLTSEDLSAINYDVGLFDPRITDESKAAMINRIAVIFRRKSHEDAEAGNLREAAANNAADHGLRMILKNRLHSDGPGLSGYPLEYPKPLKPQAGGSTSEEMRDRREVLQGKLRRLRNLYLLVRPLATGVKLTREELHEIFQSHEGVFEPSLTEAEKIALVTRMADTIRMAYVSQQLIRNTSASSTPASASAPSRNLPVQNNEGSPIIPQVLRPPLLIFAQRLNNNAMRPAASRPDKMHVSGKIQVDLNIDGDIGPEQESLLSKLL